MKFQTRVRVWVCACFGDEVADNKIERNHRFIEESLELVQACGCTKEHVLQIVDYVYGRPTGEPHQEVGGVQVTLAALCAAQDIKMNAAAEAELARCWTKIVDIREKQARKVKDSALPGSTRGWHPTHKMRFSGSAIYDDICDQCGMTDANERTCRALEQPCEKQPSTIGRCTCAGSPDYCVIHSP